MNDTSLSNISLESIQEKIEGLRLTDLETCEIEGLIPRVKDLTKGFPFIKSYLPLKTAFRARKSTGIRARETPILNVRDLWYPPVEKIENYGRLNSTGEQLFYCSNNQDTAIVEVVMTPKSWTRNGLGLF